MIDDDDLKQLLKNWKPGEPPVTLREVSMWWRMWHAEIRIPVPVAVALVIVLAVTLVGVVNRDTPMPSPTHASPLDGFEPVAEFNARVVPSPTLERSAEEEGNGR